MESWEALNEYLLACCLSDLRRRIDRRAETVGDAAAAERALLHPLPADAFDVTELTRVRVDAKSRVSVRTNRYSVPVRLVGREVAVRLTPWAVEVSHAGREVARHPRLHLKHAERLVLDHYLDLLAERPGAFAGSLPLHQERGRGTFTASHQALWARFTDRWGERDGTRQMIEVLLQYRTRDRVSVDRAVAAAVALGVSDHRAVALLCRRTTEPTPAPPLGIDVGDLSRYDRAQPELFDYDRLLAEVPA
jgi:Mu transposase-like protein